LGSDVFRPYSFIFSRFHAKNCEGSIGVVGPARVRYEIIVPTVRFFGDLIEEVAEW
jgi:heat-inducible transcriptional repressor